MTDDIEQFLELARASGLQPLTPRCPPSGPTCAEAAALEELPVGWYMLPDGREFYGMNEFEVRAASRDAWRRQSIADAHLAVRLSATRPPTPATPRLAGRVWQTADLFAGGDSSPRTEAQRGSEDRP